MKTICRWIVSIVSLIAGVLCVAVNNAVRADPPFAHKALAPAAKMPTIPLAVLKDIRRLRPGMTRADLDWLFTPDGGFVVGEHRTYVYRYAGVLVGMVDAAGKPMLDKTTHQPMQFGEAIKIDVDFRSTSGRVPNMQGRNAARRGLPDPYGWPDDVIVRVSDPYVAFESAN